MWKEITFATEWRTMWGLPVVAPGNWQAEDARDCTACGLLWSCNNYERELMRPVTIQERDEEFSLTQRRMSWGGVRWQNVTGWVFSFATLFSFRSNPCIIWILGGGCQLYIEGRRDFWEIIREPEGQANTGKFYFERQSRFFFRVEL